MNVESVKSIIQTRDLSRHGDTAWAGLLEVDGAGHLGGALQHADCLDHRDQLDLCLEMWDWSIVVYNTDSQQEAAILYTDNLWFVQQVVTILHNSTHL